MSKKTLLFPALLFLFSIVPVFSQNEEPPADYPRLTVTVNPGTTLLHFFCLHWAFKAGLEYRPFERVSFFLYTDMSRPDDYDLRLFGGPNPYSMVLHYLVGFGARYYFPGAASGGGDGGLYCGFYGGLAGRKMTVDEDLAEDETDSSYLSLFFDGELGWKIPIRERGKDLP